MPKTITLTDDNIADYFELEHVEALAQRAGLDAEGEPPIPRTGRSSPG